jgi:hypothetical protein
LKAASEDHVYHNSKIIFGRLGELYLVDSSDLGSQLLLEDSFVFNKIRMTKYGDSLIVGPYLASLQGSTDILKMSLDQLVSLDPLKEFNHGFSIYPNPSSGSFKLETEESIEIEIINSLGQLVDHVISKTNDDSYLIQLIKPIQGIYIIKNVFDGQSQKIIVR